MSFSRPDPSSPASIAEATFGTSRRGFDQSEVKDFLRMVAAEFGRLRERERFLERELQAAQSDTGRTHVDEETMTRMLGEEATRLLITARESANEIRDKAEQAAEALLSEANQDAARIREEADIEGTRRRADAAADAEAELAMAKQQGREMVNEARAYRERVLSELARRRELAREQIEQLVHGRDRLMQAFERARLVAVDVVAEMQPLGEPNEYVNLSPTTGPLPVMIANSPRPDEPRDATGSGGGGDLRVVEDDSGDDEAATADDAESDAPDREASDAAATEDDEAAAADTDDDSMDGTGDADDAEDSVDDEGDDATAQDGDVVDPDDDESDDDDRDDVVVSLFAKLRADSDASPSGADDEAAADTATADDDEDTEADHEPTPFELRDEVLTPLIVASAKKMKRVLADEQNEVLDALRRNESVTELDALLPWASEHAARYRDAILDELNAAVSAGGAMARGSKRKMRHALVAASIDAAGEAIESWLVGPLRDRLEQCVRDGAGDNAEITKKVRAAYREWKTQHIDVTLDDIFRTAHGRGALAGFEPGTPIVWTVDDRFPACPDCDDNVLAGSVGAGDEFPTGDTFTPAHQGCRCLLLAAAR